MSYLGRNWSVLMKTPGPVPKVRGLLLPLVPLAGGSGFTAPLRNSGSKAPPIRNGSHWSQDPPQNIPQICFVGKEELKVAPIDRTPFGFFRLLFTDEFFVYLANETNAYAEYVLRIPGIGPRSRICEWKKVTVDELKTFLGIVFYQGMIQARRYNDYWKRHYLFKMPVHVKFMPRCQDAIMFKMPSSCQGTDFC
ncbi:hypothetical protein GE061_000218 [Apolygus lucorum]|uniref:PiggyBac transposable element-derived protein domain-containing protein n=1 Tax=Apolygus lucorum TaxID=248454 RepID=A0A8S9Y3Z2_APOLU|nr:hypothetical protein GE061_000218 [Apolygus lucorum]